MKVANGRIVSATRAELHQVYLLQDWYEIFSFPEYMALMEKAGTEVTP